MSGFVPRLSLIFSIFFLLVDNILKYCTEKNSTEVLDVVLNLDSTSKNYQQILSWLLTLKPDIIAKIAKNKDVPLDLLFALKDFGKTLRKVGVGHFSNGGFRRGRWIGPFLHPPNQ